MIICYILIVDYRKDICFASIHTQSRCYNCLIAVLLRRNNMCATSLLLEIILHRLFHLGAQGNEREHRATCHEGKCQVHHAHQHIELDYRRHNNHGKVIVVVVLGIVGAKQEVGALLAIVAIGENG